MPWVESTAQGLSVALHTKLGGGWCRQYSVGPLTHAAVAFEFAGGWKDLKGSVAVTVLQFLLGGGGSFSAGGPGEIHSHLPAELSSPRCPLFLALEEG